MMTNKFSPKPSCSKYDVSDSDFDTKINIEVNNCITENETVTRLNEMKKDCENVHNNNSNYEVYYENNNHIPSNLNDFGFRFFDINAENKSDISSDQCLYDNNSNYFNDCCNTSTEEINMNDNSKEANCDNRNNKMNYSLVQNNTIIPNVNIEIDGINNANVDSKHTQYIDNVFHDSSCNNELVKIDESEDAVVKVNSIEETIYLGDPVPIAHQTDDFDACSYHSSDFEFIDELEAKQGHTMDFNSLSKNINEDKIKHESRELDDEYIIYDYFNTPGPSPKYNFIPTGNDYYNLFLLPCVPYPSRNIENKAVDSMSGMEIGEDVGFNMRLLLQRNEDDNNYYKEEADESAKIIISMFPNEN